jgi:hypothetical protein
MSPQPARVAPALRALGAVAAVSAVLVAHPATSTASTPTSPRAVPSAATIVERMDARPDIVMLHPRDEGPTTVVRGGLCTDELADLGCFRMVSTKDASIIVFRTARQADDYVGGSDDRARSYGRMVLSFGSPLRVAEDEQRGYRKALRTFRTNHHEVRNDVDRAVRNLTRKGLRMRDPQVEDSRGERLGLASELPGAVDMVTTSQADVIVFATRRAAREYVGNADTVAYRHGRVVLSFGAPPRVVAADRGWYQRAFDKALG